MYPLVVGFGLGSFVALQLGPMSLFLVRSTLRRGWTTGLAIGAGIAAVDAVYCAIGAGAVLANHPLRVVLGLVGAAVLIVFGARTLWSAFRVRLGGEAAAEVATPRRAFLTSLAGTASNPLTIASWAAIFAADTVAGGVLLVAGVAIGSATWVTALASGVAVARRAVGRRAVRIADAVAGLGLVGFGGALAYGAVHDS